jgi:DinB family protein
MNHDTIVEGETIFRLDPRASRRLLEEGFGPGAWHGPDLKAALTDVSSRAAYWRPGPGRHNIAEITMHHAWFIRAVTTQLSGSPPGEFPLKGEDWFELSDERDIGWPAMTSLVEEQQRLLSDVVSDIGAGVIRSPLSELEQFNLLLGITCHAIYHAGQIQLLRVLGAAPPAAGTAEQS